MLTEGEVDRLAEMDGVHSQTRPPGYEELEVTGDEKVDKIQTMTQGSGFSTDVSGDLAVTDDGLESNPFGEVETRGSHTGDTGTEPITVDADSPKPASRLAVFNQVDSSDDGGGGDGGNDGSGGSDAGGNDSGGNGGSDDGGGSRTGSVSDSAWDKWV